MMPMTEAQTRGLGERLRGIVAFLPAFEAPGFQFGHWVTSPPDGGDTLIFPYVSFSEAVGAFLDAAYELGWVLPGFDWGTWSKTPQAEELRNSPETLARATAEQVAYLLTSLIRADRFSEGALASSFKFGLLTRILQRAATILSELGPS
jgi:hypothetical protein